MNAPDLGYRFRHKNPEAAVCCEVPCCGKVLLRDYNIPFARIFFARPIPAVTCDQPSFVAEFILFYYPITKLIGGRADMELIIHAFQRRVCCCSNV